MSHCHVLKCRPEYFRAVGEGLKTFEIRNNDRCFMAGDWLELQEYFPADNVYSGKYITCRVKYILDKGFGLQNGYVAMAIELPSHHQWPIPDTQPKETT